MNLECVSKPGLVIETNFETQLAAKLEAKVDSEVHFSHDWPHWQSDLNRALVSLSRPSQCAQSGLSGCGLSRTVAARSLPSHSDSDHRMGNSQ